MGKLKVRSEDDQLRILRTLMPAGRKTVSRTELDKFRRNATNKTGWSLVRLDGWLAHLTSTRVITIPTGDGPTEALHRAAAGDDAARRTQAKVTKGVRKWVLTKTAGHISAPQMARMKQSLRKDGGPRTAVEAATLNFLA